VDANAKNERIRIKNAIMALIMILDLIGVHFSVNRIYKKSGKINTNSRSINWREDQIKYS